MQSVFAYYLSFYSVTGITYCWTRVSIDCQKAQQSFSSEYLIIALCLNTDKLYHREMSKQIFLCLSHTV